MIRRFLKKGADAARTVARVSKGFVQGPGGPGYGVSEYEDFEKLRAAAAAQDAAEGNVTAGSEMDAIDDGTAEMSAEDLRVMTEVEEGDDIPVIVDVREPHEWATGHLPGAMHLPLGKLEEEATEVDRNRVVVIYCQSGLRSIDGSYILKRAGFPRVFSLAGGIEAWRAVGSDIVIPD